MTEEIQSLLEEENIYYTVSFHNDVQKYLIENNETESRIRADYPARGEPPLDE